MSTNTPAAGLIHAIELYGLGLMLIKESKVTAAGVILESMKYFHY